MKYLYLLLVVFSFAHAQTENDLTHRPKSFTYRDSKAVFVDFQEATYFLEYDVDAQTAKVKAQIKLNMPEDGYPIFDLVTHPTSIKINGNTTWAPEVSTPSRETIVRVLDKKLSPGTHELEVVAPIKDLLEFTETGVKNAFWVSDLEDRSYLEQFIPTNFEYDRMKITFEVHFKGLKAPQHVFANGKVTWIDSANARIEFPHYFTVDSLYFHTTPVDSVNLMQFNYASVSGSSLPVSIYISSEESFDINTSLKTVKKKTIQTLNELEADYGPFRHPSVTIYCADLSSMGLGGMEYSGATVSDINSLSHELTHSYFARGVVPANGNAGWIDESIATWRDKSYERIFSLNGSSQMASHPHYTRKTDTDAYGFGASFMAYLDGRFADRGGLKPFLNALLEKKLFTPIFTEDFIQEMELFYGESLSSIFKTYVYGSGSNYNKSRSVEKHPIHKKMGLKELTKIL